MINIPEGATVISDKRLTLIKAVQILSLMVLGDDYHDGMKDFVKQTMRSKGAGYAQSEEAIAALRAGGAKSYIDPVKLYDLVKAGKLTMEQFLSAVSVRKDPLKDLLSGNDIAAISVRGGPASPALCIEFKSGLSPTADQLAEILLQGLDQLLAAPR